MMESSLSGKYVEVSEDFVESCKEYMRAKGTQVNTTCRLLREIVNEELERVENLYKRTFWFNLFKKTRLENYIFKLKMINIAHSHKEYLDIEELTQGIEDNRCLYLSDTIYMEKSFVEEMEEGFSKLNSMDVAFKKGYGALKEYVLRYRKSCKVEKYIDWEVPEFKERE
jgi:hypothetical protein